MTITGQITGNKRELYVSYLTGHLSNDISQIIAREKEEMANIYD